MRKVLLICFVGVLATIGAISIAGAQGGQVCPDLDTGHIFPPANSSSVTITAPEGQVIVQVCVKAGSAQQPDGGPEFINYDPGVTEATFSHSSGHDVSHYSVKYGPVPVTPTPTPPPADVGGVVVSAPAPAPSPPQAVGGTPQLAG